MKKYQKLKIRSREPFILEGQVVTVPSDSEAKEDGRVLYEVLCRNISAKTFMEFYELMKRDINKPLKPINPSERE